jgi:hypothetical protein
MVLATIVAAGFVATIGLSNSAFAQGKLPESGFGQASKNLATSSPGATGEHASSFAGEPRQGIGNVAQAGRGGSVGELGCTLGQLSGC